MLQESPTRPVYLLGESFGGTLAIAVAIERPDLADRLILVNPATSFPRSVWPILGPFLHQVPRVRPSHPGLSHLSVSSCPICYDLAALTVHSFVFTYMQSKCILYLLCAILMLVIPTVSIGSLPDFHLLSATAVWLMYQEDWQL